MKRREGLANFVTAALLAVIVMLILPYLLVDRTSPVCLR